MRSKRPLDFGAAEIFERVGDLDLEALVAERLGVDLGEMLAAELDHALVDLDEHDLFHALVLQRLVGDGEVAAAHDHHALGRAVLEERQMCQHFGVGALVARGDLDDVVERHDAAVGDRVEDLDALVAALFLDERLARDLERLRVALVEPLLEDLRHCSIPFVNAPVKRARRYRAERARCPPRAARARARRFVTATPANGQKKLTVG